MDLAEDTHPIYVDKIRLKQILMNLVSNDIKFIDDEGHIIIKSYHKGDNVHIDVIDNGIGIMGEDIQKLFKKFS